MTPSWRLRSFQTLAERIPEGCHVEVWGDSVVWLFTDSGYRVRLIEWMDAGMPPIEEWPNCFLKEGQTVDY